MAEVSTDTDLFNVFPVFRLLRATCYYQRQVSLFSLPGVGFAKLMFTFLQ